MTLNQHRGANDGDCAADDNDDDDSPSNRSTAPTVGDVLLARFDRRQALKGLSAVAAVAVLGPVVRVVAPAHASADAPSPSTLTFAELHHGETETHAVAEGYDAQLLIRWGDPVEAGSPAFDPTAQTAAAQAGQWGYNNDYVGFMPLPAGSQAADHGLLCVNFEYTDPHLMFPGMSDGELDAITRERADIEMAAHGHGVIEIRRDNTSNTWAVAGDSPFARRITALATECRVSGPAAGNPRLQTSADPSGMRVIGTLNNCAGGKTPWGTVLIAEENFDTYFGGDPAKTPDPDAYARYGIEGSPRYAWYRFHDRFDIEKEPNEPNRFGWMVEVDPYDPASTPVKRTALGHFKHEGATTIVSKDGTLAVYMGDDERFEYIYRFVTGRPFDANDPAADRDLLDNGVLSVARFDADGTLTWLPLIWGEDPLTAENGFDSPADVLIDTRRAADLLGATPMDRPEDVEPNPVTGIVYAVLTNNTKRAAEQADPANPRGPNPHGHIIEMIPPGTRGADRDHTAAVYRWEIFILAGNPAAPDDGARYHPQTSADGWFASPDNVAFDRQGRIWIATDGAPKVGIADGAWAADTEGPGRALPRHFYRTPLGAELCGPEFNTDDSAYFAAVQHPGDTKGSTFDRPSTRWPDFTDGVPPRPSVQVIVKKGGGAVGV
jgi:uncharacterized protein